MSELDVFRGHVRTTREVWELGYDFVASLINDVLQSRLIPFLIDARPVSDSRLTIRISLRRMENVFFGLRPVLFDLPAHDVLNFWSLGRINDKENAPIHVGKYYNDDEPISQMLGFLKEREWTHEKWKVNIVDEVHKFRDDWRKYFDDLIAESLISPSVTNTNPPQPPDTAELSGPMTLKEMACRLTGKTDTRQRAVKSTLEGYGLTKISKNVWRIRLDKMDAHTRSKFEK